MATCTYTVPDKNASGDNFYGQFICDQAYIDFFWFNYGFNGNKNIGMTDLGGMTVVIPASPSLGHSTLSIC